MEKGFEIKLADILPDLTPVVTLRHIKRVTPERNQKAVREIVDKYNARKVWRIIKTKSGAYMLAQHIDGKQYGKKQKMSLARISEIVELDKEDLQELLY